MRNPLFRSLGLALASLAAIMMLAAPTPVSAQGYRVVVLPGGGITSLSSAVTAVDTAPYYVLKYVGTSLGATVAVTTFDWIFTTDGTAVDTTINVQATTPCGASVGTLDTDDTDCDTVTELVNEVNSSTNWRLIPLAVLGTDSTKTAGLASVADVAETTVGSTSLPQGIKFFGDSSDNLSTTIALYPGKAPNVIDARDFFQGTKLNPTLGYEGYRQSLQFYSATITGTAAASGIHCVQPTFGVPGTGAVPGPASITYRETSRLVFAFTGAATTVAKELDFKNGPLFCNSGEKLVLRVITTATHTAPIVQAFGYSEPTR